MVYVKVTVAIVALLLFLAGLGIVNAVGSSRVEEVRQYQIEACERGNILRRETNDRGNILRYFLRTAGRSRIRAAIAFHSEGNTAQAEINREVGRAWIRKARHVDSVEVPDCEEVVQ